MQRSDECQNDTPSSAGTTYPTDTYRVTYCNTLAPSRDDRAPARPHPVATLASRDTTSFAAEATVRTGARANEATAALPSPMASTPLHLGAKLRRGCRRRPYG